MFVVAGSVVLAAIAAGVLYLAGVEHFHWAVVRPLLRPGFVRAYLADARLRRLIRLMNDEQQERDDAFAIFWNASKTELISKRIFRPVEMYGVLRYMYRPEVHTLQFVTGADGVYRGMEMEDSPALRQVLATLDTRRLAAASYDRLGFRRIDSRLSRECATRVLFIGDSFTDGVGVNDNDTFVNQYGHMVRDRLRLAVCPINAGVEGYGTLEESYVLDTYFDAFGRPPLVVVMHYVNDVADDEEAVLRGAVSESDPRWQVSLSYLDRMIGRARRAGASILVGAIPTFPQFAAPETRRNYQDILRRFCEARAVRFVDLFDPLERFGPDLAYFDDDPHWTASGHRAVAATLFEATRDLLGP